MKNKKFTIGLALLIAGSVVLTNCTKNKTNKPVDPDTDVTAAEDVTRMLKIITDIGDVVGQTCNNDGFLLGFQSYSPLSKTQGTVTVNSTAAVVTSTASQTYDVVFGPFGTSTIGKDGVIKQGIIHMDYSATSLPTSLPATLFREAGYYVKVTSPTNLIFDGDTVLINSMNIFNSTDIGFPLTSPFTPSLGVNIKWKYTVNITVHKQDGKTTKFSTTNLLRTLLNTNNSTIPMQAGATVNTFTVYPKPYNSQLYLQKEYVSYSGDATGYLANGDPFVMNIPSEFAITQNFNNSPEAFVSVSGAFISPERHPFLSGVMTVDPGTKTKRKVDFGMPDVVDYNAKVTVDGITYGVDIK